MRLPERLGPLTSGQSWPRRLLRWALAAFLAVAGLGHFMRPEEFLAQVPPYLPGPELLVAITNDAWYGRPGAPDQFLAITALRAAENGVALVRAANTGYSASIDARGRVRERSALFERGYVIADVRLGGGPGAAGASFFARYGGVFVRGCWLGVLLVVGAALRARFGSPGRNGRGGAAQAAGALQGTTGEGAVEAGE